MSTLKEVEAQETELKNKVFGLFSLQLLTELKDVQLP
jgi:hypothetical protein